MACILMDIRICAFWTVLDQKIPQGFENNTFESDSQTIGYGKRKGHGKSHGKLWEFEKLKRVWNLESVFD